VRQAQASSNPLDPVLIARRAKKHLDELEVITRPGETGSKSGTDPSHRGLTTRRSISTLTRPIVLLKVQDVADEGLLVRI
jgi:hypothetical protein